MQGFVRYTSVGLYSLKQVWAQPIAQRNIMYELRQDARLTGELYRSQLTLSGRDLELAMQSSVTALVNSLQVIYPTAAASLKRGFGFS